MLLSGPPPSPCPACPQCLSPFCRLPARQLGTAGPRVLGAEPSRGIPIPLHSCQASGRLQHGPQRSLHPSCPPYSTAGSQGAAGQPSPAQQRSCPLPTQGPSSSPTKPAHHCPLWSPLWRRDTGVCGFGAGASVFPSLLTLTGAPALLTLSPHQSLLLSLALPRSPEPCSSRLGRRPLQFRNTGKPKRSLRFC